MIFCLVAGSILERFLGLAVRNIFDEFLARSLRRRAGYAGVPWPLSEATPALLFFLDFSAHPSGGIFERSLRNQSAGQSCEPVMPRVRHHARPQAFPHLS